MTPKCWLASSAFLGCVALSLAETVKDREAAVRQDRAAMTGDARWIYDDWQRGFAEAKRTGKPLLVVLRCVPCLACAGIDAQVLVKETDLDPLLDQFVCVRVINANTLDLSLFQWDYDLSFSTLFFNGDGTIYGRYGSWRHQRDPQDKTTAGYKATLQSVLALHRGYPANKTSLAGKQCGPTPFKTTLEIPALAAKYPFELNWNGNVVQSCVHCHQVGDAIRASFRERQEPIPLPWIYSMPAPETVGFTLAADEVARVEAVAPGTAAAAAGLRAGDELVEFAGQPLVSVADVHWALHRAPDRGSIMAVAKRGGMPQTLAISLPENWRMKADISRRVGTWPMRGMALGGLLLEDLSPEERERRGLRAADLALVVRHVGKYGKHAAAKNAGFQQDDVLIAIDGVPGRVSEGELIGHLLTHTRPGATLAVTVLRGEQRVALKLPMQ